MSYLYGTTGTTKLTDIGASLTDDDLLADAGDRRRVRASSGSASRSRPCRSTRGRPTPTRAPRTPVTAFLSVASKAAGFVGLVTLLFIGLPRRDDVYEPFIWVLAALTMTVGNVLALRQTNIVRMLAYSSVSQGGFILMPLAVRRRRRRDRLGAQVGRRSTCSIYAFIEPRCVRRRHRRQPQDPERRDLVVRRSVQLRPRAGRADDDLPRVAHRHPAARRSGSPSCSAFKTVLDAGDDVGLRARRASPRSTRSSPPAYYMQGAARDVDEAGARRRRRPRSSRRSRSRWRSVICAIGTLVLGILPGLVARFGDLPDLTGALGGSARSRSCARRARRRRTRLERVHAVVSSQLDAVRVVHRRRRCTAAALTASGFYTRSGVGRAARRLPHVAGGRSAVRCGRRPLPRRRMGAYRPARSVHRRRRRCRPGHAGPVGRSPRARRAAVRCATWPSSLDGAARARIPTGSSRAPSSPTEPFDGVIIANELLDNLPFRLAVFDEGWREAFVDVDRDGRLVERCQRAVRSVAGGGSRRRPSLGARAPLVATAPRAGSTMPVPASASGSLLVIDYGVATTAELAMRPWREWLRTYRPQRARRALPRASRDPGHHHRRPVRSAPGTRRRALAGPVPPPPGIDELVERRRPSMDRAGSPTGPRRDADAQSRQRVRGAARSDRPRRLHRRRVRA